jgi:peptidoglycan-associated lipoprotein
VSAILMLLACKTRPPEWTLSPLDAHVTTDGPAATAPLTPRELDALVENFARVHFAVDSDQLDAGSRSALAANAEILGRHPEVRVEIQGHADERGTVDYNLALGHRRAGAVVQQLTAYGVPPSRLDIVSFGEERPLAMGTGETAWAENRRAEFRVLTGAAVRGTVR